MTQTIPTVTLGNTLIAVKDKTIERANEIAKHCGSLEVGLMKAMMLEQLEAKLAENQLCRILFVKRDGSLREMWCSTNPSLCNKHIKGVGREHFGTKVVFDVEKGAFRSFRWESLVKVF